MDRPLSFEAILFPSDGRLPHMVSLTTSPVSDRHSYNTLHLPRMPHPEEFMDYIAKDLGLRAWKYQLVEALDGMNRKFTNPYIIFYPTVSNDGLPFPIKNFSVKFKDLPSRRHQRGEAIFLLQNTGTIPFLQ
ncbi:hypothetical protein PC9H_003109 [Pleurotus ostreatus]|uniref:Uncharacterized protein n=1 Tax=Pleurotus ostreatus TaxID=5322 RepID=A0A8H7DV15_PLEOS|nr:uncharacterized protein PC9H_003109 [Pleurotus ostreatus]KAF7436280.1 hypothetical protein PC9H_003109 [Pleurotus ostreatus]KAJ8701947.1 hypothetical protein PTI98_000697 [Pleurotus ostreatus]